jgi:Zn-dependent peptidase ImmA (M78 family)/DNA-binding XRE family transcriptional regulator
MANSVPALVTPALLRWAREESGYDMERAAERLHVPVAHLHAWEAGTDRPTLRQAEKMAVLYHRSLPVFYLPEPPPTVPLAKEFRHLPNVIPGEESPELRVALRELRRRRKIALELFEDNEEEIPAFPVKAHVREATESVGQRLRTALNISLETQQAWQDDYEAWRSWRDAVEALGVLVFQVPKVPLDEMRGVVLASDPLPVIGVSSRENPASRPFTLLHEVVHLMLLRSGDERPAAEVLRPKTNWPQLERFADAAAAAVLMPRAALLEDEILREHGSSPQWSDDEIRQLARRFRVSPLALMTRLVSLEKTTWAFYNAWRIAWERAWAARPQRAQKGGPSRVDTILSRVGGTYAALVLDSVARDLITPLMASDALDLKARFFDKLKEALISRQPNAAPLAEAAW